MKRISKKDIEIFLTNNSQCTIRDNEIIQALNYLETEKGYLGTQILGAGSFGIVVKVNNPNGAEQAAKIIISNTEEPIKKAKEEADLMKQVNSNYVVKYITHFAHLPIKSFFIITEYCKRGNLNSFLENNQLKKEEIIQYSLQLMYGLRDLQNQGIIHCDLKPDNILLSDDGKLKICDLGLSKLVLNRKAYFTQVGNLLYQPPEGMQNVNKDGKFVVTKSYDIFSAGGIIIFLCDPKFELQLSKFKDNTHPSIKGPLEKILQIAIRMLSKEATERPSIRDIILELQSMVSSNDPKKINFGPVSVDDDDQEEGEDTYDYLNRKCKQMFGYLNQVLEETFPEKSLQDI